ncbi:MAG: hypothetical protein R3284_00740 [Rubricoccaceae bacterium]|nr:hypothetical protein [Rubricoccaceae bacterium]
MRFFFALLALLLVTPLAQAQKPEDDKSAEEGLFGEWQYTVRPEDPVAEGTFVLEPAVRQVNGTFNTDGPRKMENIEMTDSGLSFSFMQPGMGLIYIDFTLEGETLEGMASVENQEEPFPIIAVRPAPDLSED